MCPDIDYFSLKRDGREFIIKKCRFGKERNPIGRYSFVQQILRSTISYELDILDESHFILFL